MPHFRNIPAILAQPLFFKSIFFQKIIMKSTHKFLLTLVLIFVAIGCSKDDSWVNEQLLGVWYNKADYADEDQSRTVEWSFMDDGTMEIVNIEFKKSTSDFLGYSHLTKGNYTIKDEVLFMTNVVVYSHNFDGENYIEDAPFYLDKDSFFLKVGFGPWSNSASISFQNRNRELKLTYMGCNDFVNALCVGPITLTRK